MVVLTYIIHFIVYALEPAFKERVMTGLNVSEGLGLVEAGINVFEDID